MDFLINPFTLVILSLIILIYSAILHEIAHGYVAERLGDPTARILGRLTLNPIPHIDLIFKYSYAADAYFDWLACYFLAEPNQSRLTRLTFVKGERISHLYHSPGHLPTSYLLLSQQFFSSLCFMV